MANGAAFNLGMGYAFLNHQFVTDCGVLYKDQLNRPGD
jgi:hypothetical protein|tara:strand:+ start:771 stop:884 length:114 start_codon:yes stop_codon:yes gene_type:complete